MRGCPIEMIVIGTVLEKADDWEQEFGFRGFEPEEAVAGHTRCCVEIVVGFKPGLNQRRINR